ncbi:C40 family peptidase [Alicyclobacillus sacchari]|uniref:C40 family peptidase n=1 Tax=Alicyclobacillus sacchari TaxID=392010 RepID=UPI001AB03286|nr:NlpC/P60 family protein [Alicyclobacillus sacchari]
MSELQRFARCAIIPVVLCLFASSLSLRAPAAAAATPATPVGPSHVAMPVAGTPHFVRVLATHVDVSDHSLVLVVSPAAVGDHGDGAIDVWHREGLANYAHAHRPKDTKATAMRILAVDQAGHIVGAANVGEPQRVAADVDDESAELSLGQSLPLPPPGTTLDPQLQPMAAVSAPDAAKTSAIINAAEAQIGKPLVWGANLEAGEAGCDPATFVAYVYRHALGYILPDDLMQLWDTVGVSVPVWDLHPGDLVFFDNGSVVGIYCGGDQMIACDAQLGAVARVSIGPESNWGKRIADVRRLY